jgi:hypothetical protein
MAIIEKDGFEFYDDIIGNPEAFILKGIDISNEIKYLKEQKIKSIALARFESNSITDLDFLKEISFIEKISIDNESIDCAGLYYLDNLKQLMISVKNKKQFLDYSKFKKLENLSIDWYSKFPDLSQNDKLTELTIWKFKPKSKSFSDLKLPNGLENFEITESNITNLKGLDLPNLRKFEAHYSSTLESVEGIKKISPNLKILIIDFCKKLNKYDELQECLKLEKIILGNCGQIATLKWLKYLKNLSHFSFWNTKLVDGDTSPCFGVEYVNFKNEKHYNHKVEEFKS